MKGRKEEGSEGYVGGSKEWVEKRMEETCRKEEGRECRKKEG